MSAPSHRFKQPDGKRYPDTRPDDLVRSGQLQEILDIGENTLLRWKRYGWITPEKREGHCTLYRVPTPERIEEIRALAQENFERGAALGRQRAIESGGNLLSAARGRASKTKAAQERAAQGLLNKHAMCNLLSTNCQTLNRWIEEGLITPALVSESGKWMWFAKPDEDALERLRAVAKGRSKTGLAAKSPESEPREKRDYTKSGVRKTVKIVDQVKIRMARGTNPPGTISFEEAAARAGVSKDTMFHWVQNGWVADERTGRYNGGIYPEALEAFLAEREQQKRLHPTAKLGAGAQKIPEGALSSAQMGELLGLSIESIYRRTRAGLLVPVAKVGSGRGEHYFTRPTEEQIEQLKRGLPRGRKGGRKPDPTPKAPKAVKPTPMPKAPKATPQPKPKATPKPLATVTPTAVVAKTPEAPRAGLGVSADFVAYDIAVSAGRAKPYFQNALGFNLLSHPTLGFRAAKVNEKPEWPWRYHERHAINGWGQWQIKAQRPTTGEILL